MSTPASRDCIEALIYRYAECMDAGDFDGVAALFEASTYGSHGGPRLTGSAEVAEVLRQVVKLYDGTPKTKHVTTNVVVEVDEEAGTATARSYFTVIQALDGFPLQTIVAGRYHDSFERADGTWRFCDREIFMDLIGDTSRHLSFDPSGT